MAKKKYVHAATLRRRVYNCLKDFPCEYTKEDVLSCIDRVPAADVEPVRHGKWIRQKGKPEAVCSECSREVVYKSVENHWQFENYCPNCGARMDKEN